MYFIIKNYITYRCYFIICNASRKTWAYVPNIVVPIVAATVHAIKKPKASVFSPSFAYWICFKAIF
jgi:hypothetical protein